MNDKHNECGTCDNSFITENNEIGCKIGGVEFVTMCPKHVITNLVYSPDKTNCKFCKLTKSYCGVYFKCTIKNQLKRADSSCTDDFVSYKLKTSKEWNEIHNAVILDPDGWDRKNYDFSFNQENITEEEFLKRLSYSTRKF